MGPLAVAMPADGQTLTNRGFVEGVAVAFPQQATNDTTRLVGDLLAVEASGDYARAIVDHDVAIRMNPNDAMLRNNRGWTYNNLSQ